MSKLSDKAQATLSILNQTVSSRAASNAIADTLHGFDVRSLPEGELKRLHRAKVVERPIPEPAKSVKIRMGYKPHKHMPSKAAQAFVGSLKDQNPMRYLGHMKSATEMTERHSHYKAQASFSLAEQLAKIAAHDRKLEKQIEDAGNRGKTDRYLSLIKQQAANRRRADELIEALEAREVSFAVLPLIPTHKAGYAIEQGSLAMPEKGKPVVMGKPLSRAHKMVDKEGRTKRTSPERVKLLAGACEAHKAELVQAALANADKLQAKPENKHEMTRKVSARDEKKQAQRAIDDMKRHEAFKAQINAYRRDKGKPDRF